jgi:hypothetical protein
MDESERLGRGVHEPTSFGYHSIHFLTGIKTMKITPVLIAIALFFIANYPDNVRANPAFSSQIVSAQATTAKDSGKAKKPKKEKKEKKAKAKKNGNVTFHDGSAESRAERDKRLTRECKGRPNAGACEGYARP